MDWNSRDHSFCESKILGSPEYLNVISSLGYFLVGGMFIKKPINDIGFKILSNLCIFIGVGSIFFHWVSYFSFRLMDEIPMILMEFFILFYTEDLLLRLYQITNLSLLENNRLTSIWRGSNKILDIKMFFYIFSMLLFIIFDVIPKERHIFPYLFGGIFHLNIYKLLRLRKELKKIPDTLYIRKNIKKSIIGIFLGTIIWGLTEITCNYKTFFILLLGHPIWHLLSCYGLFLILSVLYDSRLIIIC